MDETSRHRSDERRIATPESGASSYTRPSVLIFMDASPCAIMSPQTAHVALSPLSSPAAGGISGEDSPGNDQATTWLRRRALQECDLEGVIVGPAAVLGASNGGLVSGASFQTSSIHNARTRRGGTWIACGIMTRSHGKVNVKSMCTGGPVQLPMTVTPSCGRAFVRFTPVAGLCRTACGS
jgi:hypothetical protein